MTRNNLTDHLSWLLNNVSLTKPACRPLPRVDAFARDFSSQVQPSPPLTSSQSQASHRAAQSNLNAPALAHTDAGEVEEVFAVQDNMGRLASSGKSRKASLVSQQAAIPTPRSLVSESASNGTSRKSFAGLYSRFDAQRATLTAGRSTKCSIATRRYTAAATHYVQYGHGIRRH